MLINLRNALMTGKRLPYDAEVEWLYNSGLTQYINTGIVPTGYTEVSFTFDIVEQPTSLRVFGGTDVPGVQRASYVILRHDSSQAADTYSFRVTYNNAVNASLPVGTHTVTMNEHGTRSLIVDGNNTGTFTGALATNLPMYLFCRNSNGAAQTQYSMPIKLRALQIRDDNGVLIRDFIPVRKGTVGYLYDRVSGKLFGNAGTGDFVLGPDIVPVEYIESHGAEWIDTGVHGSQNLRTTFDYQLVYSGTAPLQRGLFGCYTNGIKYHLYCSGGAPSAFQVGMGSTYVNTIRVDNVRHSIEFNNSAVSIDGNAVATFEPYGTPTAHTLLLFALHNASGGLYSMTPMRKWRVQMWDNGTPVRSFRPVRVGTEGAMMDTLTRRIYRNAGTGAFTYGNDLKYPIPSE